MQNAKHTPRSFSARVRSNAREILLALALTVCAAGFMIAAFIPGGAEVEQVAKTGPQR